MAQIFATDRDGTKHELEARERASLMEILKQAGLSIEALCSGSCQCATCHVFIEEPWLSKLGPQTDFEIATLESQSPDAAEWVYVLGKVNTQGRYPVIQGRTGFTLTKLIALAVGLLAATALLVHARSYPVLMYDDAFTCWLPVMLSSPSAFTEDATTWRQ